MRVLFINLGRENLGIEYLSSAMKGAGHATALANDPGLFGREDNVLHIPAMERLFSRRERLLGEAAAFRPDLIGFSVYTSNYRWALSVARELKAILKVPIVFGGTHPTLLPERVLEHPFVDFVVQGEGEEALAELVSSLKGGGEGGGIAGVWKRGGRKPLIRPPMKDLDRLPLPDKALFERDVRFRDDYLILTSRGCPFRCTFCCEGIWKDLYGPAFARRRSVEHVMEELRVMYRRYRFREVMFWDNIFFTDRRWIGELMRRYRAEIGVPFRCEGHVKFLDAEVCALLKEGGCYCVDFGIQSFSSRVRREILGRPETDEEILRAMDLCERAGLRFDVDLMFGVPGENGSGFAKAARALSRMRFLNRVKCFQLTYFPRTPLTLEARRRGRLTAEAMEDIEEGRGGGFFHEPDSRRPPEGFKTLFRILPILPPSLVRRAIGKRGLRLLHLLPGPLVLLLQALVAIRGRDIRFRIYSRNYLHHLRARLFGR